MKRFFFLLLFASVSFAQTSPHFKQEQWFIQIGAFTSVKNAIALQLSAQKKIQDNFAAERDFGHFVSIHPNGSSYRVFVGPYPTKNDAQEAEDGVSTTIMSNSIPLKLDIDTYYDYRYGYKFKWSEISEKAYQSLYANSLVQLNFGNLRPLGYGRNVSLIAHTDQIEEEIFDINEAKQLLNKKNIDLLQDESQDDIVIGYITNSKKVLLDWTPTFYAYYPTENLIVFLGEGGSLISLDILTGELTLKMPYKTLYSPDKGFRIIGSDFSEFGYGRYYLEVYDRDLKCYVELIDLGVISPWYKDAGIDGLAWMSNNELVFLLEETRPTGDSSETKAKYYKLTIDYLSNTN